MNTDPVLNIFNELKELDTRNYDWYANLTPEQKKKVGLFVMVRWASAATGNNGSLVQEFYIQSMNDVNKIFTDVYQHPELQWKLLAAHGLGSPVRHEWIPNMKKITTNKLDKFLLNHMPYLNRDELSIVKKKITVNDIKDICKMYGMLDSEMKEYVDEVKKLRKTD